jgi:hypothetical protein
VTQFHGDELLFQFELLIFSSKTRIEGPDRGRRGKGTRHAWERSDKPLRRRPRMGQIAFVRFFFFVCESRSWSKWRMAKNAQPFREVA